LLWNASVSNVLEMPELYCVVKNYEFALFTMHCMHCTINACQAATLQPGSNAADSACTASLCKMLGAQHHEKAACGAALGTMHALSTSTSADD
jgi:hypothetical protein